MHPDAIIAGLRRELDRLDNKADDYQDRKRAIEAEIKAHDALDRPDVPDAQPYEAADVRAGYLTGLRRELERADKDRHPEIKAEIKRVEAEIKTERDKQPEPDQEASDVTGSDEPSEEEIAARKQARQGGQKVEQARNTPVEDGTPPPPEADEAETAPATGAKE